LEYAQRSLLCPSLFSSPTLFCTWFCRRPWVNGSRCAAQKGTVIVKCNYSAALLGGFSSSRRCAESRLVGEVADGLEAVQKASELKRCRLRFAVWPPLRRRSAIAQLLGGDSQPIAFAYSVLSRADKKNRASAPPACNNGVWACTPCLVTSVARCALAGAPTPEDHCAPCAMGWEKFPLLRESSPNQSFRRGRTGGNARFTDKYSGLAFRTHLVCARPYTHDEGCGGGGFARLMRRLHPQKQTQQQERRYEKYFCRQFGRHHD
jgi:hypothetical protein